MTMRISARLSKIQPSLTLAVSAKAAQLEAQGVSVISFGVGEPDFDTPDHIKEQAIAALKTGVGKYTPVPGTPALRKIVATEFNNVHGTKYAADQIIVSVGAKHSLFNLFMALLDEGDEVIIPTPCWVSYPELVQMAGGTPVLLPTKMSDGYEFDEAALRKVVTSKTRGIIVNSPCNPTGAVYGKATLAAIGRVFAEHPEAFVITDDIYRRLVYGIEWHSFLRVCPSMAEQTIVVDGVSKSYAMTGWRIGFTAGPKPLISAMSTLQGQSTSNPAAISQAAAIAALTGTDHPIEAMRTEFDKRRRVMVEMLRAIPGVKLHEPTGAFYCFPDLSAYCKGNIKDDVALSTYLLDEARVAVVPGTGFYAPGHVRLSYATSLDNVRNGVQKIAAALAKL
jgi:aspartate aminotransferase